MAWRAYLEKLADPAVKNATADFSVRYEDQVDDGKGNIAVVTTLHRSYNLHAGAFTSAQAIKDLVSKEISTFAEFDTAVEEVKVAVQVGDEIVYYDEKGPTPSVHDGKPADGGADVVVIG